MILLYAKELPGLNVARLYLVCLMLMPAYGCPDQGSLAKNTVKRVAVAQGTQSGVPTKVLNWFNSYDEIRRQAQLSPEERAQADSLLGKGLAILSPGPDKDAARILLQKMVNNYTVATQQMSELFVLPETEALHKGYSEYFSTAKNLFTDYLTVQDNFFAQDGNGKPVIQSLLERKERLEQINAYVHDLDSKTRAQFGVSPYRYEGQS